MSNGMYYGEPMNILRRRGQIIDSQGFKVTQEQYEKYLKSIANLTEKIDVMTRIIGWQALRLQDVDNLLIAWRRCCSCGCPECDELSSFHNENTPFVQLGKPLQSTKEGF